MLAEANRQSGATVRNPPICPYISRCWRRRGFGAFFRGGAGSPRGEAQGARPRPTACAGGRAADACQPKLGPINCASSAGCRQRHPSAWSMVSSAGSTWPGWGDEGKRVTSVAAFNPSSRALMGTGERRVVCDREGLITAVVTRPRYGTDRSSTMKSSILVSSTSTCAFSSRSSPARWRGCNAGTLSPYLRNAMASPVAIHDDAIPSQGSALAFHQSRNSGPI
jgi:hypothetical protein